MIDQGLWIKRHRTGIGGSDAPAILGISRWRSRLGVWEEKVGEAPPRELSERMIWGSRLEKAIMEGYGEDAGSKVRYVGFRRHPEMRHVIGHPDGLREDGRLVEAKTAHHLGEAWGPAGSDQVPEDYWTQVQHYLLLLGVDLADLVVLVGGNDLRTYTIGVDRNFQVELANEERSFWETHVVAGIPPDPDGSDDAKEVLRRLYPRREGDLVANAVQSGEALALLDLKDQIRILEKAAGEKENYLRAAMGSRTRMVGNGFSISWIKSAGRIGWKEVAQTYRNLIEGIAERSPGGLPVDLRAGLQAVRDGTVEGLYRSAESDRFTVNRKGKEGSDG